MMSLRQSRYQYAVYPEIGAPFPALERPLLLGMPPKAAGPDVSALLPLFRSPKREPAQSAKVVLLYFSEVCQTALVPRPTDDRMLDEREQMEGVGTMAIKGEAL